MSLLWVQAALDDDDPLAPPPSRRPQPRGAGGDPFAAEPHYLSFGSEHGAPPPTELHCSKRCAWESAAKQGIPMEGAQEWTPPGLDRPRLSLDAGQWQKHPNTEVDLFPVSKQRDEQWYDHLRRHDRRCDNCEKPIVPPV